MSVLDYRPLKGLRIMLLANELKYCECEDSPQEFRDRLIRGLTRDFKGNTIDDLICSPRDALRFCQVIRSESNSPFMSDGVILKALVNIRKRKDCPTGLKGKRQPKSTQRELDQVGYNGDTREFKELAVDCLADMYKSRTIDEIACFPREAIQLCNYVRNKAKCQGLTDAFVLSTLMNVRKAGGN